MCGDWRDVRLNVFGREPARRLNRDDATSRQRGEAAGLGQGHVRLRIDQERVAPIRQRQQADEVSHCSACYEQGRFLAEQFSGEILELPNGRILASLIVADLGARHGLAHLLSGRGLGVAAEFDAKRRHGGLRPEVANGRHSSGRAARRGRGTGGLGHEMGWACARKSFSKKLLRFGGAFFG